MKTLTKVLTGVATLAAISLPNIPLAGAASGVSFTNSAVDRIATSGSDTTYTLMADLSKAYMQSDGCVLNTAGFPLTGASPTQNACQSGAGAALGADNIYENYDHDVIVNYFPQGSSVGRGQLCAQRTSADGGTDRDARVPFIDIARSSSAPTSGFQCTVANGGEAGVVLRFVAFARDAISFTHWNTTTGGGGLVNNLTQAQLRDIYITCVNTDWGQVGGVAGNPIVVYTALPGSGTRSTWEGFLGGGASDSCIPAAFKDGNQANGERVVREHQMQPVENAANDTAAADEGNSIYYMSVGLFNSKPDFRSNSLIGDVNGISPTGPNIVSGTFPFSRNLFNVIRQSVPAGNGPSASAAARRFTGMLTSSATNGQNIGWICKAEANHSQDKTGTPGILTTTATEDWFEVIKTAYAANGMFQLAPDAFGNVCSFTDVTVV